MTDSTMVERVALVFAQHGDHFFGDDGPSSASWDDFSPREQLVATAAARAAIEAIPDAEAEFEVHQDGGPVASTSGPRARALAEAVHYATVYGQDGPVEIFEVVRLPVSLKGEGE